MRTAIIIPFSFLALDLVAQDFVRVMSGQHVTLLDSRSYGCSAVDFTGDGKDDLFVSCVFYEDNEAYVGGSGGTFSYFSTSPLVSDGAFNSGVSWADLDNDGDEDLIVSSYQNEDNLLYLNQGGGSMLQVLVGDIVSDGGHSRGCAWMDYDNDGYVDAFFVNQFNQPNYLYRNLGNGTFQRITNLGPMVSDQNTSVGVVLADLDNNRLLDVYVANRGEPNELYFNQSGTFVPLTGDPSVTEVEESHGASAGDVDNDGDIDLFVTSIQGMNSLYLNDGLGSFTTVNSDTHAVTTSGSYTGSVLFDADNDGDLDLYVAQRLGGTNYFYRNDGSGNFTLDVSAGLSSDGGDSRGIAATDHDGDGDLDLYVVNEFENNFFYRNDGAMGNWLEIDLEGTVSNRSAIGTKVVVQAVSNGQLVTQVRFVEPQSGYLSQSSLRLHFGLGNATVANSVQVFWTSGLGCFFTNVPAGQVMDIIESCATSSLSEINDEDLGLVAIPVGGAVGHQIRFEGPWRGPVDLQVFDASGRQVDHLAVSSTRPSTVLWDPGHGLGQGIYLIRGISRDGSAVVRVSIP